MTYVIVYDASARCISGIFSVGARHHTLNLHQLHMQVTSEKGKISGCAKFIVEWIENVFQAFRQDMTD